MLSCWRRRSETIASQRSGSAWARVAMPGVDTPGMLIVTSTARSLRSAAVTDPRRVEAIFPRSPDPGAAVRLAGDSMAHARRIEDGCDSVGRDRADSQDAWLQRAAVDHR